MVTPIGSLQPVDTSLELPLAVATSNTPQDDMARRVSMVQTAAPNLDPNAMMALAGSNLDDGDLAKTLKRSTAYVQAAARAQTLALFPAEHQRKVWQTMSRADQNLLRQAGYLSPDGDDDAGTGDGGGFWRNVMGGGHDGGGGLLNSVAHAVGAPVRFIGNSTKDTLGDTMGALGAVGRGVGHVYQTLDRANELVEGKAAFGTGSNPGAGKRMSGLDRIIHAPKVFGTAWTQTGDGEAVFHPETVQKAIDALGDGNAGVVEIAKRLAAGDKLEEVANDYADPGTADYEQAFIGLARLVDDKRLKSAVDILAKGHVSYGRDLARGLGANEGSLPFTLVSGGADAIFTWYNDPLLLAGKARKVGQVGRYLIDGADHTAVLNSIGRQFGEGLAERAAKRTTTTPGDAGYLTSLFGARLNGSERAATVIADHFNTADRAARRLDQLWEAMPRSSRLIGDLLGFDNRLRFERATRQTALLYGHAVDDVGYGIRTGEDVADFFRESAGITALAKGRWADPTHPFMSLPRLSRSGVAKMGTKVALTDTINFLAENRLLLKTPLEELDELGGTAMAGHTGAIRDAAGRLVGSLLAPPAQFVQGFTTRIPKLSYLPLHSPDTPEVLRQVLSYGMGGAERRVWMDRFLNAGDDGVRRVAAEGALRTMFQKAGLFDNADTTAWAQGWLNSLSASRRYAADGLDELEGKAVGILPRVHRAGGIAIPEFRDFIAQMRRVNSARFVEGAVNNRRIDGFMSKYWRPVTLWRLGFIPRAAGEEVLATLLRHSPGQYVKSAILAPIGGKADETALWPLRPLDSAAELLTRHLRDDGRTITPARALASFLGGTADLGTQAGRGLARHFAGADLVNAYVDLARHPTMQRAFMEVSGAHGIQGDLALDDPPALLTTKLKIGRNEAVDVRLTPVKGAFHEVPRGHELGLHMQHARLEELQADPAGQRAVQGWTVHVSDSQADRIRHAFEDSPRLGQRPQLDALDRAAGSLDAAQARLGEVQGELAARRRLGATAPERGAARRDVLAEAHAARDEHLRGLDELNGQLARHDFPIRIPTSDSDNFAFYEDLAHEVGGRQNLARVRVDGRPLFSRDGAIGLDSFLGNWATERGLVAGEAGADINAAVADLGAHLRATGDARSKVAGRLVDDLDGAVAARMAEQAVGPDDLDALNAALTQAEADLSEARRLGRGGIRQLETRRETIRRAVDRAAERTSGLARAAGNGLSGHDIVSHLRDHVAGADDRFRDALRYYADTGADAALAKAKRTLGYKGWQGPADRAVLDDLLVVAPKLSRRDLEALMVNPDAFIADVSHLPDALAQRRQLIADALHDRDAARQLSTEVTTARLTEPDMTRDLAGFELAQRGVAQPVLDGHTRLYFPTVPESDLDHVAVGAVPGVEPRRVSGGATDRPVPAVAWASANPDEATAVAHELATHSGIDGGRMGLAYLDVPKAELGGALRQAEPSTAGWHVPEPWVTTATTIDPARPAVVRRRTMSRDEFIRHFDNLEQRVLAAEKAGHPAEFTDDMHRALAAGDWRTFSQLRGYTPAEMADFAERLDLYNGADLNNVVFRERPFPAGSPNAGQSAASVEPGSLHDELARTGRHPQVDDILPGITPDAGVRRLADRVARLAEQHLVSEGGEVVHDLAGPIARGGYTRDHLERADLADLHDKVTGPEYQAFHDPLINRVLRYGFDNVIGRAVSAIARQPLFLLNYAQALDGAHTAATLLKDERLAAKAKATGHDLTEMRTVLDHLAENDAELYGRLKEARGWANTGEWADATKVEIPDSLRAVPGRQMGDLAAWHANDLTVRNHVRDIAIERATADTIPFIDDHRVRSQFQEYARNLMPFWFAEEQFIARWARTLAHSPEALRKAQLYMNGLRSTGIIHNNEFGEEVWSVPGSGPLITALSKAASVFGGDYTLPVPTQLEGQVAYTLPGVGNQGVGVPQFGPLVSVPVGLLARQFPELGAAESGLLGDRGTGRGVIEQLVPAAFSRFYRYATARPEDYAAMTVQALQYMEANGQIPTDASPEDLDKMLERVQNHTRILLLTQAVVGFASPASPSVDIDGIELNQEYQELLRSGIPLEDAVGEFLARNPDATPYTVFGTKSASGAPLPATAAAGQFYSDNAAAFSAYSLALPWLLPQATATDPFERGVYHQQLAVGLRARKAPIDVWKEIKFAQGADLYFESKNNTDAALADTRNPKERKAIRDGWADWKQTYFLQHPVFAEQLQDPTRHFTRQRVLNELSDALYDPAVPKSDSYDAVRTMTEGYFSFTQALAATDGKTSARALRDRRNLRSEFATWAHAYAEANPAARALWQRVIAPEAQIDDTELETTP